MVQPLLIILARNYRILALGFKALAGGTRRVNPSDLLWMKAHSCCYCFSPHSARMGWVNQQAELAPPPPWWDTCCSHTGVLCWCKDLQWESLADNHYLRRWLPCTSEVRTAKANELILWTRYLHLTWWHQEAMFFTGGGWSSIYICHNSNSLPLECLQQASSQKHLPAISSCCTSSLRESPACSFLAQRAVLLKLC